MPVVGGSIAAPIVGGIIGNELSSGDRDAANAAKQQALQQFLNINVPDIEKQKIILQHYHQTGQLTPALAQKFQQSQTALNKVSVDPSTRAAQMSALAKMQDISSSNGEDAQAKAQTQQAINASNSNEAGQRGAIVQNFAARGVGGAGAEMAAQLMAEQGDANRASNEGLQASANSQQRALQAMASGASLASGIHAQDYGQQADAARASDMINQFNTSNSQNVENQNTGRQNDAQHYNVSTAQGIANQNTGVDNQQEIHNKGLYQQQFQNQMALAGGRAGQYGNVAANDTANANRTANQWAGIGQAVGQGAGAYGQSKGAPKDEYSTWTANEEGQ